MKEVSQGDRHKLMLTSGGGRSLGINERGILRRQAQVDVDEWQYLQFDVHLSSMAVHFCTALCNVEASAPPHTLVQQRRSRLSHMSFHEADWTLCKV